MFDDELQRGLAVVFVEREFIGSADALRHGIGTEKSDGIESGLVGCELKLEMFFADYALALHGEFTFEHGLRKALTPHLLLQSARDIQREIGRIERAVGFDNPGEIGRGEQALRDGFEGGLEFIEVFFADADARCHGVSAEFLQQVGVTFR